MPSVAGSAKDARYLTGTSRGVDGVVRITSNGQYGTGALLWDGQHILTAAHLLNGATAAGTTVYFETATGTLSASVSKVSLSNGYDPANANQDFAILTLTTPAPVQADRYELYRKSDEVGQKITFSGYGQPSTGSGGMTGDYESPPIRRGAENHIDGLMDQVSTTYPNALAFKTQTGGLFYADFDDGSASRDASGLLLGQHDLGQGGLEGTLAAGDSGGPAFIGKEVAGVASYRFKLDGANGVSYPDINSYLDGTFGEFAAWQRVSQYTAWIDQTVRADWKNAPTKPSEVQKSIVEGNSGTSIVWALLSIPQAATTELSVAYRTVDGTAKAGQDYLPVSGRVQIHIGEDHAAIPVEVIGDTLAEATESFYLEVSDPVGTTFSNGASTLRVERTIIDNDTPVQLMGVVEPLQQI